MRSIRFSFLPALFFFAVATHAAVSGIVVDKDGAPLAGASVAAFTQETRRDVVARLAAGKLEREPLGRAAVGDDGRFRVVTGGRPVVELVVSGAGREVVAFDAADGDDVGTLMLREAKPITGRVTAGGKPVAGAIVLTSEGNFAVKSGEDGTYSLPRQAGTSRVVALHNDFAPSETVVRDDKPATVDFALDRGVEIRGRIVAPNGRSGIAEATIIAGPWTTVASGEEGNFVVPHAPARWKSMRVASPTGGAVVPNSNAKAYEVHLRKPGSFSGTVKDSKTNAPVAGMRFRFVLLNDPAIGEWAITDAKGAFAFRGAAPGRYDFLGTHPLYQLESNGMMENLGVGEDDNSVFAAHPLAIVRGRVIDEAKAPVAGATISRSNPGAQSGTTTSAPDGSFVMRLAATQAIALLVLRDGFAESRSEVAAAAGETKNVVVTLRRGVKLAMRIVDRDERPVADAAVTFIDAGNKSPGARRPISACGQKGCSSGSNGSVDARILPGTYDVSVTGPTITMKQLVGVAIDERSSPMTVTVDRGVEIAGRVVYSDGEPVPEAMVTIRGAVGFPSMAQADASGAFSTRSAPAGKVTLTAEVRESRITGETKEVNAPTTGVTLTIPRGGKIAGHVVDASSHEPVTDFNVYVLRDRSMSRAAVPFQSEDGSFAIENVAPGSVEIQVVAVGYARATASGVIVEDGKTATAVELKMERAGRLKGRITTSDGQPISGATIFVRDRRDNPMSPVDRMTSDANGDYEMGTIPPGERTIAFTKRGFVSLEKTIEAVSGKEQRLDVTLDRGREISGRVVDEGGQPVAGAEVFAEMSGGTGMRSDPDGAFKLGGLGTGRFRLRARKEGYVSGVVDVDETSAANISVVLRHGATITGRLTGLPEEQLAYAFIQAHSQSDMYASAGRVGAGGRFSIPGMPDGKVTVTASVPSGASERIARKDVEVVNGSAPEIELSFVEGFTIHGRVTVRGRPLPNVTVLFIARQRRPSTPVNAETRGDGTYTVSDVTAGEYDLSVVAQGMRTSRVDTRTISGPGTQDLDLPATTLRGRIVDAQTMAPIPDASVTLLQVAAPEGPQERQSVASDSDGRFLFDLVLPGEWRVTAQSNAHETASKSVIVGDAPAEVELQLGPGTATVIRVVDATTGQPLNANFSLSNATNEPVFNGETGSDGAGRAWVKPGHYSMRVFSRGYSMTMIPVDLPGPEIRVALSRAGTIVIVSHRGVGPVRVTKGATAMTSTRGRFDNLAAGEYVVELLGEDGKPTDRKTALVQEGQTTTVTFD